jgi:hypothetical protein
MLNDLEKGRAGIPQRADLPGMLVDLLGMLIDLPAVLADLAGVFENRSSLLDNLTGLFLAFAQQKFDGLRQSFMPLGQSVEPFVNRHKLLLRSRRIRQPPL